MKAVLIALLLVFAASALYMQLRGHVRLRAGRQMFDHSTFMAPINVLMLAFSAVPRTPYLPVETFPELDVLRQHWPEIRDEAAALARALEIKASSQNDDAGFNSFFKTGWKRFYLKWYGQAHPSAARLTPRTLELVSGIPSIKAAMFAELPHGARLGLHRDPYAGSLRYHLGLIAPGTASCYISVDGQPHVWHEGEPVMFDETYLHYAENQSGQTRIVLFCDIERPMTNRLARAFNRWFGGTFVAAASSPNSEGDPKGLVSRLFLISHHMGQWRRRYKAWNPTVYRLTKVALIVGALAALIWW